MQEKVRQESCDAEVASSSLTSDYDLCNGCKMFYDNKSPPTHPSTHSTHSSAHPLVPNRTVSLSPILISLQKFSDPRRNETCHRINGNDDKLPFPATHSLTPTHSFSHSYPLTLSLLPTLSLTLTQRVPIFFGPSAYMFVSPFNATSLLSSNWLNLWGMGKLERSRVDVGRSVGRMDGWMEEEHTIRPC